MAVAARERARNRNDGAAPLIRSSLAIRLVRDRIERVAATDFTALIEGAIGPQLHPSFIEVFAPVAIHHCHRTLAGAEEDGPVMSSSCWRIDPRCGKSARALWRRSRV